MGLFTSLIESVNKEYDRRIRRASEIVAYGMHHGHGHGHDDDENDDMVIANVSPGTHVKAAYRPGSTTHAHHTHNNHKDK